MTDEEPEVPPVELTEALERAAMAGLQLRSIDGKSIEATCPVCGARLTVSGKPWKPVLAARRLDAFALVHLDHDGTVAEE
jgi:hypothetical protein